VFALIYSLFWFRGGPPIDWSLWWQPVSITLLLFASQILMFYALEQGDVSVAVPVFGVKVVIVALISPFLLGEVWNLRVLCAAFLAMGGVAFLNFRGGGQSVERVGLTLLTAGLSAAGFAVFDVLLARWGAVWGAGRLLPIIMWLNLPLTFTLIPRFKQPLSALPASVWPWLAGGAVIMGVQSVIFIYSLVEYGNATVGNVLYAARGLISVVMVYSIGHWFGNAEREHGSQVMRWRFMGALMMLVAIVLVLTR
jgi:drug/metabolite transporter (DMT)-like permease